MRFTLLVPGWIGVPVTRWMFLGFIQRGTPTSQMLRLLINLSMLLQISFVRITSRDFPLSFSMSCSSQERERELQLPLISQPRIGSDGEYKAIGIREKCIRPGRATRDWLHPRRSEEI